MNPLETTINRKINYIRLINWMWEIFPYTEGYKASYGLLFLAIVDSINRNMWAKTSLPYEYLTNKCRISKQVYLDARQWLTDNGFLMVEIGKNGYQMASFDLGIEVRKQTATDTATSTANDTPTDTTSGTATSTHYKTDKPKKLQTKKLKTLNIGFEEFWILYGKNVGKVASEKLWEKLTDQERETAIKHVPEYVKVTTLQYRQNPKRYLTEKTFNDQLILSNSSTKNHSVTLQTTEYGKRAKF